MQTTIARRQRWAGIVLVSAPVEYCQHWYNGHSTSDSAGGWMVLVANDPVEPGDVIVLAVDADGAGVLEAADLLRSGLARRVAVFAHPPDATVENELCATESL